MIYRLLVLFVSFFLLSCSGNTKKEPASTHKRPADRVLQERLATGDTSLINLLDSQQHSLKQLICQDWSLGDGLEGIDSIDQVMEDGARFFPELIFFSDGQVVENPRSKIRFGNWKGYQESGTLKLELRFEQGRPRNLLVRALSANRLLLEDSTRSGTPVRLELKALGKVHANPENHPFHPLNIRWFQKPTSREPDSLIQKRVLSTVRFYALSFRDIIMRHISKIDFRGLPAIFVWYNGGIGLFDRDEIIESWANCFYDMEDAEKGYDILEHLVADYTYNWDKTASFWTIQTQSVLEQMAIQLSRDMNKLAR